MVRKGLTLTFKQTPGGSRGVSPGLFEEAGLGEWPRQEAPPSRSPAGLVWGTARRWRRQEDAEGREASCHIRPLGFGEDFRLLEVTWRITEGV